MIEHRGQASAPSLAADGVEVAGARTADDRLREAQEQGDTINVVMHNHHQQKAKKVKKEKKIKPKKSAGENKTKPKKPSGSDSASARASSGGSGPNEALAACFDELCAFEGGKGFKANAYKKVAKVLRESAEVTSGKEAGKMAGIGKSSATKIQEFLDTGSMAKLEELRANQ